MTSIPISARIPLVVAALLLIPMIVPAVVAHDTDPLTDPAPAPDLFIRSNGAIHGGPAYAGETYDLTVNLTGVVIGQGVAITLRAPNNTMVMTQNTYWRNHTSGGYHDSTWVTFPAVTLTSAGMWTVDTPQSSDPKFLVVERESLDVTVEPNPVVFDRSTRWYMVTVGRGGAPVNNASIWIEALGDQGWKHGPGTDGVYHILINLSTLGRGDWKVSAYQSTAGGDQPTLENGTVLHAEREGSTVFTVQPAPLDTTVDASSDPSGRVLDIDVRAYSGARILRDLGGRVADVAWTFPGGENARYALSQVGAWVDSAETGARMRLNADGTLTHDARNTSAWAEGSHSYSVAADTHGSTSPEYEGSGSFLAETGLPDLIVQDIRIDPEIIHAREEFTVRARVMNVGAAPANASTLHVSWVHNGNGSVPPETHSVPPLAPGGAFWVEHRMTLKTPGTVQITADADARKTVIESIETNNRHTQGFLVHAARPDFTVTNVTLGPDPAQAGDEITLQVTVANKGHAVAYDIPVTITANGIVVINEAIGRLAPGEQVTLVHRDHPPAGPYRVKVDVDSGNHHDEVDETNNRAYAEFRVLPPTPNLRIVGIEVMGDAHVDASSTVRVRVANTGKALANVSHVEFRSPESTRFQDMRFLGPGEERTYFFIWTPQQEGLVRISAVADPFNVVEELDETDNSLDLVVAVLPPLGDLEVVILDVEPEGLAFRGDHWIGARACNVGESPLNEVWVALLAAANKTGTPPTRELVGLVQLPALEPAACATMSWRWESTGWFGDVRFDLDGFTPTREGAYWNNHDQKDSYVIAPGPSTGRILP